jgi:hypothetical protein
MRGHVRKRVCCEKRSFCLVQTAQNYQNSEIWGENLGMHNSNKTFCGQTLSAPETKLLNKEENYEWFRVISKYEITQITPHSTINTRKRTGG